MGRNPLLEIFFVAASGSHVLWTFLQKAPV